MHGNLTVGGQVLMGGDVAPDRHEEAKGFSLSIQIKRGEHSYSHRLLQGPQRDLWLDPLFEVSSDETTIGASRHLLYVGRKGDGEVNV